MYINSIYDKLSIFIYMRYCKNYCPKLAYPDMGGPVKKDNLSHVIVLAHQEKLHLTPLVLYLII